LRQTSWLSRRQRSWPQTEKVALKLPAGIATRPGGYQPLAMPRAAEMQSSPPRAQAPNGRVVSLFAGLFRARRRASSKHRHFSRFSICDRDTATRNSKASRNRDELSRCSPEPSRPLAFNRACATSPARAPYLYPGGGDDRGDRGRLRARSLSYGSRRAADNRGIAVRRRSGPPLGVNHRPEPVEDLFSARCARWRGFERFEQ